jgi:hypothetical protein
MNYIEMLGIAGNPVAVRSTASFIKSVLGEQLSEDACKFIANLEKFDGPELLSMRQREWLHALRGQATRRSAVKGYRASTLVRKLWELRLDLSEEAEDFITYLHEQLGEQGADFMLSDGQWRYVFALCHEVGEIERFVALR